MRNLALLWMGISLLCVFVRAELIPASRLTTWTPGTTVGVRGGIDQYFDQSGSANERNTADGFDVTSVTYGADNTGASDTQDEIYAAILDARGNDKVVYLPAGVYKMGGVGLGLDNSHDRFTIRGQGSYTTSSTSNTIGTGTKSFTVPSGLPHTSGIGVRAWRKLDPSVYMQGTVTSYSGTTLVMDSTLTNGSGTFSDWYISITLIYNTTNQIPIRIGTDSGDYTNTLGDYNVSSWTGVTGSYSQGETTFTPASMTGLSTGTMVMFRIKNQLDDTAIQSGEIPIISVFGYEWMRVHTAVITSTAGTTITVSPAVPFAMPSSLTPKIYAYSGYAERVGVENLALIGQAQSGMVQMAQGLDCWLYNVYGGLSTGYGFIFSTDLFCTYRKCFSQSRTGGGAGGGAFLVGSVTGCLFEDNIVVGFPAIETNGGAGTNAFLYNYAPFDSTGGGSTINTNHGPHNSFNLYEGNLVHSILSDGYFGGSSEETFFRNWCYNPSGIYAGISIRRFSYRCNHVGNVLGSDTGDGGFSHGQPNISSSSFSGTVSPSSGDFWLHWKRTATLTTRSSDSTGVLTLTTGTAADYQHPDLVDSVLWVHLYWNSKANRRINITQSSVSGNTITIQDGTNPQGDVLPAAGTLVDLLGGVYGHQEWDNDVDGTKIQKGNYLVTSGSGAQENNLGGDTIPNSLAYGAQPSWWPASMTWPPVNPASPTFSHEILPAAYRYINGDSGGGSGGGSPSYSVGKRFLRR